MITPQLTEYIAGRLAAGATVDVIRAELQAQNWTQSDIDAVFAQVGQSNTISQTVTPSEKPTKRRIPWQIKVGIGVPILMIIVISLWTLIQTKGLSKGFVSVSQNGGWGPQVDPARTVATKRYPDSKTDVTWSSTNNLETGVSETTLSVILQSKKILSGDERKQLAIEICNEYQTEETIPNKLIVWSTPPVTLGNFFKSSDGLASIEERTCPDWISLPAITSR